MEKFELTGSRLTRLYSVQVQIQFNSIHNSIQPRPRQGQSEQVKPKINAIQLTVQINVYLVTGISYQLKAQFKYVQLAIQFNVELAKS